jgi:hypothetical protein
MYARVHRRAFVLHRVVTDVWICVQSHGGPRDENLDAWWAFVFLCTPRTTTAAVIYRMHSIVTVSAGLFEYSYTARLVSDQKIDTSQPGGRRHFGVIYDVDS